MMGIPRTVLGILFLAVAIQGQAVQFGSPASFGYQPSAAAGQNQLAMLQQALAPLLASLRPSPPGGLPSLTGSPTNTLPGQTPSLSPAAALGLGRGMFGGSSDVPSPVEICERSCSFHATDFVCSTRGGTYDNMCRLRCSGEPYKCHGECPCTFASQLRSLASPQPSVMGLPIPPQRPSLPQQPDPRQNLQQLLQLFQGLYTQPSRAPSNPNSLSRLRTQPTQQPQTQTHAPFRTNIRERRIQPKPRRGTQPQTQPRQDAMKRQAPKSMPQEIQQLRKTNQQSNTLSIPQGISLLRRPSVLKQQIQPSRYSANPNAVDPRCFLICPAELEPVCTWTAGEMKNQCLATCLKTPIRCNSGCPC